MRDLFLNFLILNAKKICDLSRVPFGVCLNRVAGSSGKGGNFIEAMIPERNFGWYKKRGASFSFSATG